VLWRIKGCATRPANHGQHSVHFHAATQARTHDGAGADADLIADLRPCHTARFALCIESCRIEAAWSENAHAKIIRRSLQRDQEARKGSEPALHGMFDGGNLSLWWAL